jgi:acetyl-CoA C-acetyltransferase/acetyl-CoA acyltransferase
MKERLAIIDGLRTPFAKAGTDLKGYSADNLGAIAVREILNKVDIDPRLIDEVIIGNVAQPANAANIARVIALKAGLDQAVPAYTVHRNCASGMEAVSTAACKIFSGEASIVVAGGTESMSNIPLLFGKKMTAFFEQMMKARTMSQKLRVLSTFKLSFLKPVIGVMEGLTDPVCGLIMGLTAENIARDFRISREAQDAFSLESHLKAASAIAEGRLAEEIIPIPMPPKMDRILEIDNGPRASQSMKALQKLKPYFIRDTGTVTVGNACPLTDGAAAMIVMSESKAKELNLTPLGFVRDFSYAGMDPSRMGLGPVYATAKVFDKSGLSMTDIDLVEINEAFAAQVIGCVEAFKSKEYAKKYLNRESEVGEINTDLLNVNGGAIALGHPVGTTGARLIITQLKELRRRQLHRGLATLCIGGGQGGAFILETE